MDLISHVVLMALASRRRVGWFSAISPQQR
jgi:hypothetical protein